MKKYFIITLCMIIGGLVCASSALALDSGVVNGELTIGTSTRVTTIGLSPKVSARYINPGTDDATSQWFSIATAHPGGNLIYGSAQNLNNIYHKSFTTGTALSTTNMNIPAGPDSAIDWSTNLWSL